jgi:hypothetical protein
MIVMWRIRYSYVTKNERGLRSVAAGVLWIEAPDRDTARQLARQTLRATCDAVCIRSINNSAIN